MRHSLALFLIVLGAATVGAAAEAPYHLIKEIQIGGEGGWDYISVDSQAHRLYVSHATKIVVVDIDEGKIIGEIPETTGVHGFALAPDIGRGFSSNGRLDTSTIVDLKTLKAIGTVATGGNPDAILYEPSRGEVYTFNGRGRSATVFDARTGKVLATVVLNAKPEAAVADAAANRVFVNLEDTGSMAAIDLTAHTVAAIWKIDDCEEPTGLGYDATNHRLFSACSNKVMAVTDSTTGRHITSIPIGEHPDGAAYDPVTGYAFASNGEGTVTIAHLDDPVTLRVVQTLRSQPSGRTMILDPVTHNIYVPAATLQPAPPGAQGRPQPVADSLKVLVYGLQVTP